MRYSVIIPMYRSEMTIEDVVNEVRQAFESIDVADYEIILVNDCSPDKVLYVAQRMADFDQHITVIDLAKNVGQTNATMAGYSVASGEYIITMDDDMQTPGYEIPRLVSAILDRDDDIVFAKYDDRGVKRPLIRRIGTIVNCKVADMCTKKPKGLETNSFMIMRRFIAQGVLSYRERNVYQFGVMFELTNRVSNVLVEHRNRLIGKSGYSFKALAGLLLSGFLSFSLTPIRIITALGLTLMACALVLSVSFRALWLSLMLALSGVELLAIGLTGEYLGRLFISESGLPRYIIRNIYSMRGPKPQGVNEQFRQDSKL